MPTIAIVAGVIISMYWNEGKHAIPHFHARYGDDAAIFNIKTLEIIEGSLPGHKRKLVEEWAAFHRATLLDYWDRARNNEKLPRIP